MSRVGVWILFLSFSEVIFGVSLLPKHFRVICISYYCTQHKGGIMMGEFAGGFTSTTGILVLFILLVIISKAFVI